MHELSESPPFNQLDEDHQTTQIRDQRVSGSQGGMLSEALDLHERGFVILPLKPRSKEPLVKWKEFQSNKPTVDDIKGWFAQEPEINIGP